MENNQKGFIVPLLIAVIALLVIGGGVYIYNNKKAEAPATVNTGTQQTNNSNSKTYTDTKQGYSFEYPEKLSLFTSGETVNLSHSILFDNHDGGCDLKGDSELSKTLTDFDLSIKIVFGEVNPPYVDGSYSKGVLNGKWSYMGAEGCGQTSYYFPISGNRTLVVTKSEIQILSNVVSPDIKAKVMAVPGAISSEEAKIILDQILSTFKFTSSSVAAENMVIKVYFAKKSSLDHLQCSSNIKENDLDFVYRTIPKTQAAARASIEELLKGPTQEETKLYSSDILDGTYVKSITITNGEALIDFNKNIEFGVTSCSGAMRILQIRQTLLQFSTIKTVKFSVEGRTEDIFQP